MYKLLVIAHREYAAMVATKAFLFTLIMMPVLMFGGIILMPRLSKLGGGKTQKIIVIDQSGKLFASIKSSADARNTAVKQALTQADESTSESSSRNGSGMGEQVDFWEFSELALKDANVDDAQRLELSEQIRRGELYAFVEIPATVVDVDAERPMSPIRFVSQDAALSSARQWLDATLMNLVRTIRLDQMGIDAGMVAQASAPLQIIPTPPYTADADGNLNAEKPSNALVTLFVPFGIMMLMFMVIFLAAQPMLESGMEEKGQRIAELLLGAVSPTQLMAGKLLGNVCGSLVIFVIYGIGGWLILGANDMSQYIPIALIPWFILFQLLGVLFFSSIFLTVGASISELKEAQSLLLPVWLVLSSPLMVWFAAVRDPNGVVATSLSFFPPATPLMMILRIATGQAIPVWQPPLAALLLLLSTVAVIYLAGRIYRASLLRTDSASTIKQIIGRLKQA